MSQTLPTPAPDAARAQRSDDPSELGELAKSVRTIVRRYVAANPHTGSQTLALLAVDPDAGVRAAVEQRPETSNPSPADATPPWAKPAHMVSSAVAAQDSAARMQRVQEERAAQQAAVGTQKRKGTRVAKDRRITPWTIAAVLATILVTLVVVRLVVNVVSGGYMASACEDAVSLAEVEAIDREELESMPAAYLDVYCTDIRQNPEYREMFFRAAWMGVQGRIEANGKKVGFSQEEHREMFLGLLDEVCPG